MVNSTVVNFALTTERENRLSRRRAAAEYKLGILREADACATPLEVAALLRRERLYMSHLVYWRAQQEAGDLRLLGVPRGQFSKPRDAEITDLKLRLQQVEAELEKTRRVIAMHGRLSALVENLLEPSDPSSRAARARVES